MKKLTISILIVVTSFFLHSCNDDFMERFPQTEIGRENFFNTRDDLQMYINSFINWPGQGMYVEASDDGYTTGAVEFRTIMMQPTSSSNINIGWSWNRLRQINFFLENFSKADISQADLDHYEGVARFHRARFYMGMVKRFGDVPWYDKVLEAGDPDLFKARDSREFVIGKVFEDYQFAADHVKPAGSVGEVNKWVVKTFMARHALHEGTYRKYHNYLSLPHEEFLRIARDQSKDIIESGEYLIYKTGNPQKDYSTLFENTDLTGNSEIILLNRSIEGERGSGYWSYIFGNYEHSPSKDLLQAYLMNDGTFYSSQPGWETKLFVEEFQNRDPRLSQTYAYPGWIINNTGTYALGTAGTPYIQEMARNFTGYHQIKGFVNNSSAVYQSNIDWPVLRFAEVLLIYAEARAELKELTQADLDLSINQLRSRAGIPNMLMNPPVDPVQQARYPLVTAAATTQWAELLEIRRERRVELARESRRYNDLMRYRAGRLLEKAPEGIFFPGLGNYDLTGDGHPDIKLIAHTEVVPPFAEREVNAIGQTLVYFRTGPLGTDAVVYLKNGDNGNIQVASSMGVFSDPKYYYRPVPQRDVQINPELVQIFGWE